MTLPSNPSGSPDLDQLTTARFINLEDLVDRDSLREVLRSFAELFGISARIFSGEGELVADAVEQQKLCKRINESSVGRAKCQAVVSEVKRIRPGVEEHVSHTCFSGATYKIASLSYDGRSVGRIILGPYLSAETKELPATLLQTAPEVDPSELKALLTSLPRARTQTVLNITEHLRSVLDLILFSGHKALLTSQMHLASVRESYRELQDKNARLQEAYDKLKELDQLKSNFIATVSHELRTPLTSIIGYSEMLDEGIAGELLPEQTEFVKTIRVKGEQLLTLIMSLLDLSKLESGTMSLTKQDVDIVQIVNDVVSLLKPVALKKEVEIVVRVEADLPTLRGDANRIRQAVLNVADNAVKFTPEHGTVQIALQQVLDNRVEEESVGFALLSPAQRVMEVRIADTGIGIPEAFRTRVFEAFYQVDSSSTREYGGTGLGLAIVKRLVEAHQGTVRVESNQPTGSVFVLSFPLQSAET